MDERRQVPRYLADVNAELSNPPTDSASKVVIEILSVQGCCLRGTGIPEIGRKCRLSLEWQGDRIHAESEVAWKSIQGLAGLKFLSMDRESSESLRELLATLRMQPMAPMKVEED
jgi:hypothetical protein